MSEPVYFPRRPKPVPVPFDERDPVHEEIGGPFQPGKPITVPNVVSDIGGVMRHPNTGYIRGRLRSYEDQGGPDINEPVPVQLREYPSAQFKRPKVKFPGLEKPKGGG